MIDHVILTVADFVRSITVLQASVKAARHHGFLDFPAKMATRDTEGVWCRGRYFFWLKEREPRPDAVHVGFAAQSQAKVREYFDAAVAAGARIKRCLGHSFSITPTISQPGCSTEWPRHRGVNKTGQVE